jgi:hypothetical protein
MIMNQVEAVKLKDNVVFNSYTKALENEKSKLYTEVYDLIVSTPLRIWEDLYQEALQYSKGLKPLMINTATTQIINEELEFFNVENNQKLETKALKDIYEGIRIITALENMRIESGFNPIFVQEVHDRMSELQKSMLSWYENHLFIQHLIGYLTDKPDISKKYLDLLSSLQINKRTLTKLVEKRSKELFQRILE